MMQNDRIMIFVLHLLQSFSDLKKRKYTKKEN